MTENTAQQEPTIAEIREWLTTRVAFYLSIPAEEIPPEAQLLELGLDSVYAMTLSGDIEDHYDLMIDPTSAWDHPSVGELAGFISEELGNQ